MDKDDWADELAKLSRILTSCEIDHFLDSGTLLGAVRENDFIAWDNDIDIGALIDDPLNLKIRSFISRCVQEKYSVTETKTSVIIKKQNKNICVSITKYRRKANFYISEFQINDESSWYLRKIEAYASGVCFHDGPNFADKIKKYISKSNHILKILASVLNTGKKIKTKIIKIPAQYFEENSSMEFRGWTYAVPKNFEEYLEYRYGQDWRVPRGNWNYFEDDGGTE